jgi:ABC-type polysaccharide/polyol phosphate transport system ATPase subunit
MEPLIRFEDVWKKYRIGGSHYRSIREDIVRAGAAVARGLSRLTGLPVKGLLPPRPTFWALRGLNVEIHQGERVGIIGANGAGKTTALRLMGRITAPSKGKLRVHGKVGAMISVGAGIHPELSGRENIFLYGSIMGLKRREVQSKFDSIVAFAGVEEFLDTPVKYYSSGMRIRLGFSVAVHVDPDIMLVDEVLAVGDYDFQRNCLEKIDQLAAGGCTIVYVSHDLYSVKQACRRVIFLNHGEVAFDGDAQEAVNHYLDMARQGKTSLEGASPTGYGVRWGSFEAVIEKVALLDAQDRPVDTVESGTSLIVEIHYHSPKSIQGPEFIINIKRNDGLMVCASMTSWEGMSLPEISGRGTMRVVIERLELAPGSYTLTTVLSDKTGLVFFDYHADAYPFTVTSKRHSDGIAYFPVRWEVGVARNSHA